MFDNSSLRESKWISSYDLIYGFGPIYIISLVSTRLAKTALNKYYSYRLAHLPIGKAHTVHFQTVALATVASSVSGG